jgi:hypothetical protein
MIGNRNRGEGRSRAQGSRDTHRSSRDTGNRKSDRKAAKLSYTNDGDDEIDDDEDRRPTSR